MNANGLIRGSYPDSVIVFGLMVRDGRVMDAPPVVKWTVGLEARSAWRRLARRGATLQWLAQGSEEWVG